MARLISPNLNDCFYLVRCEYQLYTKGVKSNAARASNSFGSVGRRIYVESVRGERHHRNEAGGYDNIGDSIFAEQLQCLFVGFVVFYRSTKLRLLRVLL